jgi:hypothetical protein
MHEVIRWRLSRASGRICPALIACVVAFGIACDAKTRYRLSLRVSDGTLLRTLALVSPPKEDGTPGDARFTGARAEELIKIYGQPKPDGSFFGRFAPTLPADLGGSGVLLSQASPLGTLYTYRERMRGSDAPLAALDELRKGIDEAHALTEGWLQEELGPHPAAAVLDTWLQEHIIPDVGEFAAYSWLLRSGLMTEDEFKLRFDQFFVDRYDADATARFETQDEDDFTMLTRLVLKRAGVVLDAELEEKLKRLDTVDAAFESLARHVVRSERFRTWMTTRTVPPDEAPLPPGAIDAFLREEESPEAEAVSSLFDKYLEEHAPSIQRAGGAIVGPPEARVDVTLALSAPPIKTNGTWQDDPRGVVWNDVPLQRGSELSPLLHATWTEPDIEYQVEHFGRTLLTGKALLDYEEWRSNLDAEDRRIWDELVDLLRPGPELRTRIEALRLPTRREPAATEPPSEPEPDVIPHGAKLLLDALGDPSAAR